MQHRGDLSVLVHPNTGCQANDFEKWSIWGGKRWKFDTTYNFICDYPGCGLDSHYDQDDQVPDNHEEVPEEHEEVPEEHEEVPEKHEEEKDTTQVPFVTLNNGVQMPAIAAGTWQFDLDTAHTEITDALQIGWNHVDTAHDYCNDGSTASFRACKGGSVQPAVG